jgi:hypothetical protein
VRQSRADGGDARAHVIELRGQVRKLLFDQRRALVCLDRDLSSPPFGRSDQFGRLSVGVLLGAIKRV